MTETFIHPVSGPVMPQAPLNNDISFIGSTEDQNLIDHGYRTIQGTSVPFHFIEFGSGSGLSPL